jgi:membrane peptidoglycan carboxypeptidase
VWVGNDDGRPMNRVMGGNLPARLWHDVMLAAHESRTPMALPGTVPTGAAILAARPGEPADTRDGDQPLMPRERIGSDFVDRVAGTGKGSPPQRPAERGWLDSAKDLFGKLVP